jgi:hypothetical protein
VPKELCEQRGRPAARAAAAEDGGAAAPAAPPPAAPPATIATPLAALRARVARLLDRTAPRRPDELALAEAVCALRWPNWGPYRGGIDLELLRRALDGRTIDGKTLTWLDSHAFAEQCRKGGG